MGRTLILAGCALVLLGVLVTVGGKLGLGHLPGDLNFKGERFSVSFPLVTCLILSAALSLIFWLVRRFLG